MCEQVVAVKFATSRKNGRTEEASGPRVVRDKTLASTYVLHPLSSRGLNLMKREVARLGGLTKSIFKLKYLLQS